MFFVSAGQDYNKVLSGATPFARLMGQVVAGAYMARGATAAHQLLSEGTGDPEFLNQKIITARFYLEQLQPSVYGLLPSITGGSDLLFSASL